jgi:hypothetical protein
MSMHVRSDKHCIDDANRDLARVRTRCQGRRLLKVNLVVT